MYVTVSLKIELDATASLTQIERQIQEAGREAMKEAPKQVIRQHEEQTQRCSECGSDHCQTRVTKRRVLLTSFGRVEVALKRLRCQQCGHRFRPADARLTEARGHNVTESLLDLAALVSTWPYETAPEVLTQLSRMHLSDERLRQPTNEQGSALAMRQGEQAQEMSKEAVSMAQIRAQRAQGAQQVKQDYPEWLHVGLDLIYVSWYFY